MENDLLSPPSLCSIPGISLPVLERIFHNAARFYEIAPWESFRDEIPIEIRYPADGPTRITVILGGAGETFGLLVYDSWNDLGRIYMASEPLEMVRDASWLSLTFDTADFMSKEDLGAIAKYHWPIVNEQAYPGILRVGAPGPQLHPPTKTDLDWLAEVLPALNAFFMHHDEDLGSISSREFIIPIQAMKSPDQVYLRILTREHISLSGG